MSIVPEAVKLALLWVVFVWSTPPNVVAKLKIFKLLRYKQRPCRGHFWGEFWVLSLPNMVWLCWNFHQKLACKNSAWRTFEKYEFSWEQDGLKVFTFGPTGNPHCSLKIAKIDKNRYYAGNFNHWAIHAKIKVVSFSPFQEKHNSFLHYLGCW